MLPAYLEAYKKNKLRGLADEAMEMLKDCSICPRKCSVNRLRGQKGTCRIGLFARVYSYLAHHGEEPPVSGSRGSGTIFFSGCNMRCVYCQNYEFSQSDKGKDVTANELAGIMLELQKEGVHNINLVTPTHVLPQILEALDIAVKKGLNIPLVYNTSGYEDKDVIRILEGIVDIYLVDMRYADRELSEKYSKAKDYPEYNREAVLEMHRQVGTAKIDEEGLIDKGLIIRHLVLPNNLSGTEEIARFLRDEVSQNTYVSLMSQYAPYYKAPDFSEINRRITLKEYLDAQKLLSDYGIENGWIQQAGGLKRLAGVNIKPAV
ncbi:MAG: radical SAM protein [Candidatus Omnitrophica bacterium]|nr:radical SAM protein [Candidatus Omnitrophota bacterium]